MQKWSKEERKEIGSRIKQTRKAKGLLQEDLANQVGLKVGTISKYEQGDRTPGIRQLTRIAEVLDCNVSEFITKDTDFDAFLHWLSLSSIKPAQLENGEYLLQVGSKSFRVSEEELSRIMGFVKKQFLKVLLQMTRKESENEKS